MLLVRPHRWTVDEKFDEASQLLWPWICTLPR
eukprot:COSAG06_NODE_75774_length_128_cov_9.493392_1_plen_31_part_10